MTITPVDYKAKLPTNHFNPHNDPTIIQKGLVSGIIGAVVASVLAKPIYDKDRRQINEKFIHEHRFKPVGEIALGGFLKLGTQGIFYNLFNSASKNPQDIPIISSWKNLGCSLGAGLASAPLTNLFEQAALLKGENNQKMSSKDIWYKIYKDKRIFRGLAATAMRDAQFVGIYAWLAPYYCKKICEQTYHPFIPLIISSSIVGALGGVLQTPADVLRAQRHKTRLKTENIVSYWESAKTIPMKTWTSSMLLKASIGARAVPAIVVLNECFGLS